MSSVETGQMSPVETGQMSSAETGQMFAFETRQMLKSLGPKITQMVQNGSRVRLRSGTSPWFMTKMCT